MQINCNMMNTMRAGIGMSKDLRILLRLGLMGVMNNE